MIQELKQVGEDVVSFLCAQADLSTELGRPTFATSIFTEHAAAVRALLAEITRLEQPVEHLKMVALMEHRECGESWEQVAHRMATAIRAIIPKETPREVLPPVQAPDVSAMVEGLAQGWYEAHKQPVPQAQGAELVAWLRRVATLQDSSLDLHANAARCIALIESQGREIVFLSAARDADFEVFHEMRMKITKMCGDPYKLHDEALDAIAAELTTIRAQLAETEQKLATATEQLRLAMEEIDFLRSWGNKDCTAMADAALTEHRAAIEGGAR